MQKEHIEKPTHIPMSPVKSSQIAQIGHDPASNTLSIQFNGGSIYHYDGVTADHFDAFKNAESVGKHFGSAIRGKFPHRIMTNAQKAA